MKEGYTGIYTDLIKYQEKMNSTAFTAQKSKILGSSFLYLSGVFQLLIGLLTFGALMPRLCKKLQPVAIYVYMSWYLCPIKIFIVICIIWVEIEI